MRSSKTDALYNLLGNVSQALAQWLSAILIARLLSPAELGTYSLGQAVATPIVLLMSLQLRNRMASDASSGFELRSYFTLRILGMAASFLVIAVVAMSFFPESAEILLLIGLFKCFEAMSDVCFGVLQVKHRLDLSGKSQVAKGAVSLVILGISLSVTRSLASALLATAVCYLLFFVLVDLRLSRKIVPSEKLFSGRIPEMKKLFNDTLPIGASAMLVSLTANIPRYFLEKSHGPKEVAMFSVTFYFFVIGTLLINSISQGTLRHLATALHEGRRDLFQKQVNRLLLICLGTGLAGFAAAYVFGGQIMERIYGAAYREASGALTFLMLWSAVAYLASALSYIVMSMNVYNVQFPVAIAMALLSSVSGIVLIPQYGVTGAIASFAVAITFQAAFYGFVFISRLRSYVPAGGIAR